MKTKSITVVALTFGEIVASVWTLQAGPASPVTTQRPWIRMAQSYGNGNGNGNGNIGNNNGSTNGNYNIGAGNVNGNGNGNGAPQTNGNLRYTNARTENIGPLNGPGTPSS